MYIFPASRIKRTIKSIKARLYWLIHKWLWILPKGFIRIIIGNKSEIRISIIVTTYIERYESCFKSLMIRLTQLFPFEQIVVVANGHYDKIRQEKYLAEIRQYCSKFSNVLLIDFANPESVCKIWNTALIKTRTETILSINEDTMVSPFFRRELLRSGILKEQIAVVNNTWSLLLITMAIIRRIGYLDERLLEIGGDDDDYAARCAMAGVCIPYYHMRTIRISPKKTRRKDVRNSWGKLMQDQMGGYSSVNSEFLRRKWQWSYEPFEGAVFVPNRKIPYWGLRDGMATPDFYPERGFVQGSEIIE